MGQLTDDLDDLDLLGAGILDNHIELGLLFDGFSGGNSATRHGHRHRRGGGDAPLFFEQFHQFGGLEHSQFTEGGNQGFEISSHCLQTPCL